MIKISVCIETIFKELEIPARIRAVEQVVAAGFEFWRWENKDLAAVSEAKQACGITLVGMVGSQTPLTDPEAHAQVLTDLSASIEQAQRLACPTLIVTSGKQQEHLSDQDQQDSITAVLQQAAPLAEAAGVTLVLEPLNVLVNHPGIYLSSSHQGFAILKAVNSTHVKMLFDIYHQQITEGNIIATIKENIEWIGHFHIADVPGRQEPGTGELNYENIFRAIAETDYRGYVGCEFLPSGDAAQAVEQVCRMAERA